MSFRPHIQSTSLFVVGDLTVERWKPAEQSNLRDADLRVFLHWLPDAQYDEVMEMMDISKEKV